MKARLNTAIPRSSLTLLVTLAAAACSTALMNPTAEADTAKLSSAFERECDQQIARYGDGQGPSRISEDCLRAYFDAAAPAARAAGPDDSMAAGYRGLLILRERKPVGALQPGATFFVYRAFAGSSTRLRDIQGVTYNADSRDIEVLNLSKAGPETLVFGTRADGNVAPLRVSPGR